MKLKLASLILFASVISVTQLCCAGQTKYAPIVQAHKTTVFGSVVEKNELVGGFTIIHKLKGESKLVSGLGTTNGP